MALTLKLRRFTGLFLLLFIVMSPAIGMAGLEYDSDRPGRNFANFDLPAPDYRLCQKACQKDQRCKAATYVKPGVQGPKARCWLKNAVPPAKRNKCCVTWVRGSESMQPVQQGKPVQMQQIPGAVKLKPGAVQMKPAPAPGPGQPHKIIPGLDAKLHQTKFTMRENWDLKAPNLKRLVLNAPNPDLCRDACAREKKCQGYTYVKPGIQGPQAVCYLKGRIKKAVQNNCCVSGAKVPPAYQNLSPDSAKAKANQKQALQYRSNLKKFMKTAKMRMPAKVAQANRKIQIAQKQHMLKDRVKLRDLYKNTVNKPINSPSNMNKAQLRQMAVQMAAKPPSTATSGSSAQINQALLKSAGLQPVVTGILTAPVSPVMNYVHEGGYVILFGRNFGKQPGKVMLTYYTEPVELTTIKSEKRAVTLEPLHGDWARAWNDTMIVVRIPILPPGYLLTNATLTLWRDGNKAMKLDVPVRFWRKGAGVHSIRATPEYGDHVNRDAAVFGGELMLTGESFGHKPGKIYIELTSPLKGLRKVDLLPAFGTWQKSWKDRFIYAKVPDLKINAPTQTAMLVIEPSYGGQGTYRRPISFGPRLVYALVTGKEFLELSHSAPDNWTEENGPLLKVFHGPDCTWYRWFGSDGNDFFFRKKPMPANTRVVRAMIAQVDPKLPWTTWDIVINEVTNLVSAFMGSPLDIAEYVLGGLAKSFGQFFDPNIGRYDAQIRQMPSREDPEGRVRWYTTCLAMSPACDLPVVYLSSFLVEGPAGYCPGEIVNLHNQ
jgi:hypothetical protein